MTKKKQTPLNSKECRGCNRWFVPKRKDQVYCEPDCRKRYYQVHYFGRVAVEKTCPHCGDVFETACPVKQIYCKPECREAAARERAQGAVSADIKDLALLRYQVLARDNFRCVLCGKDKEQWGKVMVVNDSELGLVTLCPGCSIGRESTEGR